MTEPLSPPSPVVPVAAATLMLLRDAPGGVEVLMIVRHEQSGFAAGALVFPGGKVDPVDTTLRTHCTSCDFDEADLALRIAGIRETYEECGLILGRMDDGEAYLSREAAAAFHVRDKSAKAFAAAMATSQIRLATDDLVPWAHWITPPSSPKRFDTHFFVAYGPVDQIARADGHEATEVVWTTPAAAITASHEGQRLVLLPTYLNLRRLSRYTRAAAAIEAARAQPVVTVRPDVRTTPTGFSVRLPPAAGYDTESLPPGFYRAQ